MYRRLGIMRVESWQSGAVFIQSSWEADAVMCAREYHPARMEVRRSGGRQMRMQTSAVDLRGYGTKLCPCTRQTPVTAIMHLATPSNQ